MNLQDGIYFNLDEETYHKVQALSSSGIRDLLESPVKFWFNSSFNPLKEEKKSKFLLSGKLFHSLILENDHSNFAIAPDLNKNSTAFKEWLSHQSNPVINKSDLHEAQNLLRYYENAGTLKIFNGGFPEVTVIWTSDGIKRKARIDYLLPEGLIDLKTFLKSKKVPLKDYVTRYFYTYAVHIQLVYYLRSLSESVGLPIKGNARQKALMAKVWDNAGALYSSVMFIDRQLPQSFYAPFLEIDCPDLFRLAREKINQAEAEFVDYSERFGINNAWVDETTVQRLKDTDFPESFGELIGGDYE